MGTPYKMKGSPMARNFGAPFKAKNGDTIVGTSTKGSKKIKEGIKNKTDKELQDIVKRNLEASTLGHLPKGGEYRENMPAFMKEIATRSDSVRAGVNTIIERSKNK